jgi:DNA-binding transcriptional regulator YhcF (GntR family)
MAKELETVDPGGFRGVVIDRNAEVPIGVQIAWALRAQIRDGRFEPSQRLPGLRELAEATGVNFNTVRAVYQRLEHEGLIDSRQGSGTFVTPSQRTPSTVATIADDAARQAHATGVDPREVATALYISFSSSVSVDRSAPSDATAERRRQLRDQIAGLERTLGELEAGNPGVVPTPPTSTRGGSAPRLLDIDALEHVRTSLVRRLAIVQTAIDTLGRADDASGDSDEARTHQAESKTATTSQRTGRPPKSRPRATKTRPAPAGA